MKKYILLVCTFWVSALIPVMGQSFIFNGDTLKGSICMIDDSLQNDTMLIDADTWATAKDTTHGWYTRGDVKIKTTLDSIVYFTSLGPGKGGVYFTYGTRGCGDFVKGSEIYKDFSPDKYELAIKGPDCLKEGDTAVYSVDPIFTKNLGDFIGIDNYYWNINQKPYPSFVDTIIYVSGDGSSITFVAGAVSGKDSIVVNFGRCNQDEAKRVVKHLDKKAPEIIIEDTCIAVGSRIVTFRIPNPQEGLFYKWLIPSPQFSAQSSTIGDNISVKLNDNSNGEITVLSSYDKNNWDGCSVSTTSFMVNRMMGSGNRVKPDKTCYSVGDTAHIKITGILPDNTRFKWQYPTTGWNLVLEDGETEEDVIFRDSIKLVATEEITESVINATMLGCSDVRTPDVNVYVRPAGVGDIIGKRCVSRGDYFWYHVNPFAHKPYAHHFEWTLPEGMEELRSTSMKDSIYVHVKTSGELGNMTVIPQGINGSCNGPASSEQIFLEAKSPSSISQFHCVASGKEDTVTLWLDGVQENQNYHWILPNGVVLDPNSGDENLTFIKVHTSGIAGTYPIHVYAENSVCGNSDTIDYDLEIAEIAYSINFVRMGSYTYYSVNELDTSKIASYKWYENGVLKQGFTTYDIFSTATVVTSEVLLKNGCTQSITIRSGNNIKRRELSNNPSPKQENVFATPNPANNILHIDSNADNSSIRMIGINGVVLDNYMLHSSSQDIDISDIPSGQYVIILSDGKNQMIQKLLIQH